jgi:hypothetical protein
LLQRNISRSGAYGGTRDHHRAAEGRLRQDDAGGASRYRLGRCGTQGRARRHRSAGQPRRLAPAAQRAPGQRRDRAHFAAITGWRTEAEVERRARDHDIVVIDSPPHAETEAKLAIRAADLVVLPVQPSPMDVWATKPTLDLAALEKVPVLLVLNRVPARANLVEAMLAQLAELGVEIADARIGNRVALATAMLEGRGVTEAARSSRAAEEIAAVAQEIARRAGI